MADLNKAKRSTFPHAVLLRHERVACHCFMSFGLCDKKMELRVVPMVPAVSPTRSGVTSHLLQDDLKTITKSDGKFYRLPGMLEAPVQDYTFMIRKDLFDAAGVDVPAIEKDWTWDDLYDALVKVKAYMVSEGMIKESDYVWSDLWCGSEVTDGSGGNLLKLMAGAYDVQAGWSIGNGYAKDVLNKLPMEFAVEAQKLLSVSLEGTVG